MQISPLVSIIIPCYNQAKYLSDTLDCVSKQTYKNWECLIINDGSTDDTENIALKYAERDKRYIYYKKKNGGLSSARNLGLRSAKGEFIQLLDSDDLIEHQKLEKQVKILMNKPNISLIYSDMRYFSSEKVDDKYLSFNLTNQEWLPKISGKNEVIIKCLMLGNIMPCNSPLLRVTCSSLIGYFDENLFNHEDYDYWNRMALSGMYFHFDGSDHTNALVRVHPESMSKNSKMEIGFSIVQLRLFTKIVKSKFDIVISEDLIRQEKKKLVKLFLKKEINKKQLKMVFNFFEKFKLAVIFLIPKKFRYYFLTLNIYDFKRKLIN